LFVYHANVETITNAAMMEASRRTSELFLQLRQLVTTTSIGSDVVVEQQLATASRLQQFEAAAKAMA
jgi:hypothetical protein